MIRVDVSKCTGCRACETACAFYHSGKINRNAARIKVVSLFETGVDGPVVCVHCEERYCLTCPEKALALGADGQVVVSPSLCTVCRKCERKCPIGAIEVFREITHVCDLCGGRPKCVDACTEGALTLVAETKPGLSLAGIRKDTVRMNPSEKRRFFVSTKGGEARRGWGGEDV